MNVYASRHYGLMVLHPYILPVFIREALRNDPHADDLVKTACALPDQEFYEKACRHDLPDRFFACDEFMDELELFDNMVNAGLMSMSPEFTGTFMLLPQRTTDPSADLSMLGLNDLEDGGMSFNCETVVTIPLDNQPFLFNKPYENFSEIITELSEKLVKAGFPGELIEKVPWDTVVGCIDGVEYES